MICFDFAYVLTKFDALVFESRVVVVRDWGPSSSGLTSDSAKTSTRVTLPASVRHR
jgi:hypothetical protein